MLPASRPGGQPDAAEVGDRGDLAVPRVGEAPAHAARPGTRTARWRRGRPGSGARARAPSGSRTARPTRRLPSHCGAVGAPPLEHLGAPRRARWRAAPRRTRRAAPGTRAGAPAASAVVEPVHHVPAAVVGDEARAVLAARVREGAHGRRGRRVGRAAAACAAAATRRRGSAGSARPRRSAVSIPAAASNAPAVLPAGPPPEDQRRRRCALCAIAKVYLVSLQLPEDHAERVELAGRRVEVGRETHPPLAGGHLDLALAQAARDLVGGQERVARRRRSRRSGARSPASRPATPP